MRKLLTLVFLLSLSLTPAFARQRLFGFCELGNQTVAVQGFVSPTLVQASYPQCTVTVYLANSQSVSTAKYLSGGTISGTAGQTVTFFLNGGSTGAIATATLSATNTIAPGSTLTINTPGAGYSGPPTTATCSSGTATCSGTVQITSTVIGTLASLYADNNGTVLSNPFIASKQGAWYFYPDNGRYDVQFTLGTPNPFPTPFTEGDQLAVDPLFDTEFPSVTQACTFAAALPATLTVTRAWLNLPTQTFACDLLFQAGGRFQPGSGQTLTLGTVRAGLYKIFDDSAGGTIGSLKAQQIYPEWWGTLADACTASTASFSGLTIVSHWTGLAAQTFTCPMTFVPGGLIDAVAGAQLVVQYPVASATQQIFGVTGTIAFSGPAGPISIVWWGSKCDNAANDTVPIGLAVGVTQGLVGTLKEVDLPAGTCLTDTITQATSYGITIAGLGPYSSILKSLHGNTVIDSTMASPNTMNAVTMKNFGIDGNGGSTGHGIYFHTTDPNVSSFNTKFENLVISNVGGRCVYLPNPNFQMDLDHIDCKSLNDNGIEVKGGPGAIIQNSYVHNIGPNKAGYVVYNEAILLTDNGLDANVGGTWGKFGVTNPLAYGFITLINCNVEFFGAIGVDVVQGFFSAINTTIRANHGEAVQAIRFESTFEDSATSTLDAQTIISGGPWLNNYAIHGATECQTMLVYNPNNAEAQFCYAEGLSTAYNTIQFYPVSVAFGFEALGINLVQSPDAYFTHQNAFGATPTITAPFGASGDLISGFDSAGQVVIGAGPTNQFGTIQFASTPAYRGITTNCSVEYLINAPENGTVNITASSGGLSTVTWVSGVKFNTGWPTGLPVLFSVGGTLGILSNNTISTVASNTSMTINPGPSVPLTGVFYIMPIRNQYLFWHSTTTTLTIDSLFAFVPGDTLNWQCIGR